MQDSLRSLKVRWRLNVKSMWRLLKKTYRFDLKKEPQTRTKESPQACMVAGLQTHDLGECDCMVCARPRHVLSRGVQVRSHGPCFVQSTGMFLVVFEWCVVHYHDLKTYYTIRWLARSPNAIERSGLMLIWFGPNPAGFWVDFAWLMAIKQSTTSKKLKMSRRQTKSLFFMWFEAFDLYQSGLRYRDYQRLLKGVDQSETRREIQKTSRKCSSGRKNL